MTSYLNARSNIHAKNGRTALPVHSSEGDATIPVSFDEHPSNETNHIDHGVTQAPYERAFSPYDFNGGTTLAISGEDYAVVAADTRLSSGYEILSRNVTKLHELTSKCVLGSAGCKTDIDQLRSVLDINMKVSARVGLGLGRDGCSDCCCDTCFIFYGCIMHELFFSSVASSLM